MERISSSGSFFSQKGERGQHNTGCPPKHLNITICIKLRGIIHMNKQEMVKAIAMDAELTQVAVNKVLNSLEKITHETLARGEKVQLTGFLSIKPVYRAPRKGYDPLKNVAMDIEETMSVSVKAGEKLKTAVEGLNVADFRPVAKDIAAE